MAQQEANQMKVSVVSYGGSKPILSKKKQPSFEPIKNEDETNVS